MPSAVKHPEEARRLSALHALRILDTEPEERFDAVLELEWPIEGLEPLSFVLTRLFEPPWQKLEFVARI